MRDMMVARHDGPHLSAPVAGASVVASTALLGESALLAARTQLKRSGIRRAPII